MLGADVLHFVIAQRVRWLLRTTKLIKQHSVSRIWETRPSVTDLFLSPQVATDWFLAGRIITAGGVAHGMSHGYASTPQVPVLPSCLGRMYTLEQRTPRSWRNWSCNSLKSYLFHFLRHLCRTIEVFIHRLSVNCWVLSLCWMSNVTQSNRAPQLIRGQLKYRTVGLSTELVHSKQTVIFSVVLCWLKLQQRLESLIKK